MTPIAALSRAARSAFSGLSVVLAAGLTTALLAAPPAAAQQSAPKPAMWRMSDADSTVWIFGSVHLLDPELKWRRPELAEAMAEAEIVYFEAPIDFVAQARASFLVAELGMNPNGEMLSEMLSPETAAMLAEIAEELGVSAEYLEPMRPWLVVTTLSGLMAQKTGATTSAGVDVNLGLEAAQAGKELRYFETVEQQLRFFADMPLAVQVEILESTLIEYRQDPDMLDDIVAAWVSGDLVAMDALLREGLDTAPQELYDVLFLNRNRAWAEELDAFMAGSGDALVVVGAGHMSGVDSLIGLLEARGFAVERY